MKVEVSGLRYSYACSIRTTQRIAILRVLRMLPSSGRRIQRPQHERDIGNPLETVRVVYPVQRRISPFEKSGNQSQLEICVGRHMQRTACHVVARRRCTLAVQRQTCLQSNGAAASRQV